MRMIIEIAGFLGFLAAAVVLGGVILWLLGSPLQLGLDGSLLISLFTFVFVLPAVANIWIMFRGGDGESYLERLLAGIRGFGMILCAVAMCSIVFVKEIAFRDAAIIFGVGSLLWWGSFPLSLYLQGRRK